MKTKYAIFLGLMMALWLGCKKEDPDLIGVDFRQEMRQFVQEISQYSKSFNQFFVVIPQNGHQLVSLEKDGMGTLVQDYVDTIDGMGREDLFYGYDKDDKATDAADRNEMIPYLDAARNAGVTVMVTDYCSTTSKMDDSYAQNNAKGYISFAADHRELDNIPSHPATPYNPNIASVYRLNEAQNFLYILDPTPFGSKDAFVDAVAQTDFDAIVMDYQFDNQPYSGSDMMRLHTKANGGNRLVISYMSIGEAEDYRYYWNTDWKKNPPTWLGKENPDWNGNYKVKYWKQEWKDIILGDDNSYLKKIIDSGFDGVYLDIIDAFEYYEEQL